MTITNFVSDVLVGHEMAPSAPSFNATSSTSLLIGTGTKPFVTQAGTAFKRGQYVRMISTDDPTDYMEGNITDYVGPAMTVGVTRIGPTSSGTASAWVIVSAGDPGAGDVLASLNGADFVDKVATFNNLTPNKASAFAALTPDKAAAFASLVPDAAVARTTLFAAPQDMPANPMIYNGEMLSDVRNEGADYYTVVQAPATETYTLEQYRAQVGAGAVVGIRQDTGIGNRGFQKSMQVLCVTPKPSLPAGELDHIELTVEGCDIGPLQWGTPDAQPLTLQFWATSSLTRTWSVQMMPGNNFASVVKSYTTTANVYSFNKITFPALTPSLIASFGGSILTGAGQIGMKILFDLGAGSNFITATPDAWGAGVSTVYPGAEAFTRQSGATMNFTGIQLDIGTEALPFRHLPRDVMERKVARYMYKSLPQGIRWLANGASGNWAPHSYVSPTDALVSGGGVDIRWPVEMARAPTVSARSPVSANNTWRNYSAGVGGVGADSGVAQVVFPFQRGCFIGNPGVVSDIKGSIMQINVLANANLGGD